MPIGIQRIRRGGWGGTWQGRPWMWRENGGKGSRGRCIDGKQQQHGNSHSGTRTEVEVLVGHVLMTTIRQLCGGSPGMDDHRQSAIII